MEKHVKETSIGAFEAKTNLNRLLHEVEDGKVVYKITRRGKAVAKLVPVQRDGDDVAERVAEAMRIIREKRKKYSVTIDEIIEWRNEGRK